MKNKNGSRCPQCNAPVTCFQEFCDECGKLLLTDEAYDAIADDEQC